MLGARLGGAAAAGVAVVYVVLAAGGAHGARLWAAVEGDNMVVVPAQPHVHRRGGYSGGMHGKQLQQQQKLQQLQLLNTPDHALLR